MRISDWSSDVCSSDLCVAMRPDHPLARSRLSVKQWLSARHVAVSSRRAGLVLEDVVLQREGLRRDVAVRCQYYYAACHVAATSDLLLVLPRYYGEWFAAHLPLKLTRLPLALPRDRKSTRLNSRP